MPKLDPGRLIREAQELMATSKEICARSRHAVEKSKRLEEIFTASHPAIVYTRRKRPLKH
jgi:hypothetical protein